jgi:hypothetical protein
MKGRMKITGNPMASTGSHAKSTGFRMKITGPHAVITGDRPSVTSAQAAVPQRSNDPGTGRGNLGNAAVSPGLAGLDQLLLDLGKIRPNPLFFLPALEFPMSQLSEILQGIADNRVVPYLGPGVLADARSKLTGEAIPAGSDSLILAMNGGKPMAPKLMYEFPRAAMNQELKRGRSFITQFLTKTYKDTQWTRASLHDWLASVKPAYVIDINRDTQLQDSYAGTPHLLIVGVARIAGTHYRFRIFKNDGTAYKEIPMEEADAGLPILFKPMGTPLPEPLYIASDADYVDYITELMGGFAIPAFLKEYRKDKQYLLLGLPLTRDSERMVLSDIVYAAKEPKGWFLSKAPTDKERRFCGKLGFEVIEADHRDLLAAAGWQAAQAA